MIYLALMFLAAHAKVFEIKEDSEVNLYYKGSLTLKLSSNPSTGYSWKMELKSGSLLQSTSLDGTYYPPAKQIPGAGGYQLFELKCSESCYVGYSEEINLKYSRPWETEAGTIRTVLVSVSSENSL